MLSGSQTKRVIRKKLTKSTVAYASGKWPRKLSKQQKKPSLRPTLKLAIPQ